MAQCAVPAEHDQVVVVVKLGHFAFDEMARRARLQLANQTAIAAGAVAECCILCHNSTNHNEESAQRDANTARWQNFSPRRRPPSPGRGTAKIESADNGHYLTDQVW